MLGNTEDDMRLLLAKRFLIAFESGVIVVKHWRMHNLLRKDRYKETEYKDEKKKLFLKDNNTYTLDSEQGKSLIESDEKSLKNEVATVWQPNGNRLAPQDSLVKYKEESMKSRRKEVKKEYNKPYELFEKKLKEVTAVLTEAKDNLWSQITAAEEKVKAEKENDFKRYFENHDDYAKIKDYRGWEQIFDKTWLNKGKKYDTIFKEIDGKIKTICDELAAISDLNSEFETVLLVKYKSGASLTEILSANRELKAQKEELERKKAEQQQTVKQSVETPMIEQPQAQPAQAEVAETDEELISIDFRVVCTKTKLKALGEYMKINGIKYGRVPKGE